MAIELSAGEEIPTLEYKYVFLENLALRQARAKHKDEVPRYELVITLRLYAVDDSGFRHYQNSVRVLTFDDYIAEALALLAEGDASLMGAMQAIENALATIISHRTTLGTATTI